MAVKLEKIIAALDDLAPSSLAAEWDNVGLQLGDSKQAIDKVLVTLDINQQVLQEAINNNVDLIVAHHPFIFKGLSQIDFTTPKGQIIHQAIKEDIAFYVAHTNYDIAPQGLNDLLAAKLKVTETEVLEVTSSQQLKKLVVFVPQKALDPVREAIAQAGGGWLGDYSHTAFYQAGTGTFKPLEQADPYLGQPGEVNQVAEYRLETIVSIDKLDQVINDLLAVHPYEEVAYDIYPLDKQGSQFGLGRIGKLTTATTLEDYSQLVKEELDLEQIKVVGDLEAQVKKIALCSGSGADLITTAANKQADVLVTGDVKYHEAQMAKENELYLIDAGHYGTEKIMAQGMAECLQQEITVEVVPSQINTNPWKVI
ncbi:Nif3-like dinuclear metal center hexameric protein [Halanaerobaculum tunisiense]